MKIWVCVRVNETAADEPEVSTSVAMSLGLAVTALLELDGIKPSEADAELKLKAPFSDYLLDPFGLSEAMSEPEGPWFYVEQHEVEESKMAAEIVDLTVTPKTPIEIYTDGACSPNPGPGGWAAIIRQAGQEDIELSGPGGRTTNNQMELMGAICGLEALPTTIGALPVTLFTDSQYVKNGIMTWIHGWKRNGWMTSAKKPVLNKDLWQRLDAAAAKHDVSWRWVKGHSGHPLNERADRLAVAAGRLAA